MTHMTQGYDLHTKTGAERVLGIRQAALRIQQDLPDLLGESLVTNIRLSPYAGDRIRTNGGVTLKVEGEMIIFYIDIVNRNEPLIQNNERHVDIYIRSLFMNDGGTTAGFVEEDGYPSAASVMRMLRFMGGLVSHGREPNCLRRDIYFGVLVRFLPDGWHMTRALQAAAPPSSLGHVRIFKIPEDRMCTFNLSFGELSENDFGFKVNNSLIIRTPDDFEQVFTHEHASYHLPPN